jgi:hypothetical protein
MARLLISQAKLMVAKNRWGKAKQWCYWKRFFPSFDWKQHECCLLVMRMKLRATKTPFIELKSTALQYHQSHDHSNGATIKRKNALTPFVNPPRPRRMSALPKEVIPMVLLTER